MSKVIVFGAHGNIGQKVVKLLANSKYQPTAVIRNADQAKQMQSLGSGNVATEQLTLSDDTVDDLAKAILGHQAVVVTAGSGGKNLLAVDLDGVVKASEAAVKAKVRRFILVSAIHADNREFGSKSGLAEYYIAKHYADRIIQNEFKQQLDYTIVRPTMLTDDKGTGKISFIPDTKEDIGKIPRDDVALVIVEILENRATFGKVYDFKSGDLDISDSSTWK